MANAIATMAIGEKYQRVFRKHFLPSLQAYSERVDAELVVFDDRVDKSARGMERHVSWQKCEMLRSDSLAGFSQVCWIDADIVVNDHAPDIFQQPVDDRIGITKDTPSTRNRFRNDPRGYYRSFGLETTYPESVAPFVLQGGLLLVRPDQHRDLLLRVYEHDYRNNHQQHEQPALGFEIISSGNFEFLDPRFNFLVGSHLSWHLRKSPWYRLFGRRYRRDWCREVASENYFIHYAGALDVIQS